MSYFILSQTSNLNNILSTESISPAAFYQKRNAGFRSYEALSSEPLDYIRLYKSLPSLESANGDETLMAIEISEALATGVFEDDFSRAWTNETIYLSPTKDLSIHFRCKQELEAAFNGTRMSIETKFADRYKKRAKAQKQSSKSSQSSLSLFSIESPLELPENHSSRCTEERMAEFELVDRIKGALFCFCLGDQLAVPKEKKDEYVQYMQTLDDLVNSVTQVGALGQQERISYLESVLYGLALKNAQKEDRLVNLSGMFDLRANVDRLYRNAKITLPAGIEGDSLALDSFRNSLEERLRIAAGKKCKTLGRPTICEDGVLPYLSLHKMGPLADYLVNELVRSDHYAKAQKNIRYPFARECGKSIVPYFGDQWSNSHEREYVNKLLTHLNEYSAFDFEDACGIDDEKNFNVLKSLAFFCERESNKDLGEFYRFLLIKCGVTDFRLPFAIWGAVFGFSAIPKTLCDTLETHIESETRKLANKAIQIVLSGRVA